MCPNDFDSLSVKMNKDTFLIDDGQLTVTWWMVQEALWRACDRRELCKHGAVSFES